MASRVTHSAALHTYAFTIDASSVPSPLAIMRATAYENWRADWMTTAMRPSLAWVSWYSPIGLPNTTRSSRVLAGRLVRRLHHADGSCRGLQPAVLESGHLVVEARGPCRPRRRSGWRPARTSCRTRSRRSACRGTRSCRSGGPPSSRRRARQPAPRRRLHELEAVALASGLRHDEQRQAAVALRAVGIGAGQQHQDVGAGAERAPRLHAVDQPAGVRPSEPVGVAETFTPATSEPKSGSVTATAFITSADASGQPLVLLLLGAAREQGRGRGSRVG